MSAHACCHAQGRGKSGVDEVQLSKLNAAVESLEANGGIPVGSASSQQHGALACMAQGPQFALDHT
jgi:hypothetical protein